jgi:hypothetical protein
MSVSKKRPRYPGPVAADRGPDATHVEWMARALEWERMLTRLRSGRPGASRRERP